MTDDLDRQQLPSYLRTPAVSEMIRLAFACVKFNEDEFAEGFNAIADAKQHLAITAFYLAHEHHGAVINLIEGGALGLWACPDPSLL